MKRVITLAYLERKAKNARDFPSFLSGLCPDGHKIREQGERDSILRQALLTWGRLRGSIFSQFGPGATE